VLAVVVTGLAPVAPATAGTLPARLAALYWAEHQAGAWYCWGGTSGCFDCSGLVYAAYAHAGITLPRTTYAMAASRRLHFAPVSQARRGWILFFGPGHVELKGAPPGTDVSFGALEPGTRVGFHRWWPGSWWHPTAAAWVG
jgi:cell wall-associated NlpC family hydrolase